MVEPLLLLLMAYASVGLVVSLAVHVTSFFGITLGGETLFFALHIGIFPLWIPVVFLMQKATGGMQMSSGLGAWNTQTRQVYWNVLFAGCPPWMKFMTKGFFYYAIANFVFFLLTAPTGKQISPTPPPAIWHGFSGHWMVFYSAGLAMATTAYRRGLNNLRPRCPSGHPVVWGDRFCAVCGAQLSAEIEKGPS